MVYGGKVLDNFDRRILFAYLDQYLGDFVFDSFQPFHFYKGHQTNYTIPYAANSKMDFLRKFSHTTSVALYVFSISNAYTHSVHSFFEGGDAGSIRFGLFGFGWHTKFTKCNSNKHLN